MSEYLMLSTDTLFNGFITTMANDAANMQLPIMVRQPKMVWPGLDKEGLHLKSIAGDGNCLFASLSDQLYGTPSRHEEIRATVIHHMRTFRPLYEDFVDVNEVIQKRATRAMTESIRKQSEEDAFEGYLASMSHNGAYGGQAELLAFVRAYQQDVMVHLPPTSGWNTLTLPYLYEEREPDSPSKPALHICYGGDEDRNAHYDSSQKSEAELHDRALASRPKPQVRSTGSTVPQNNTLTPRALRHLKSDPARDMMHELVTRGTKDLRGSFDDQRARSPSVTSSHYSTSSKRSFDDDGEQPRALKRTDRKQRSLRTRAAARQLSGSPSLAVPLPNSQPTSSGPPTPTSSQDTDSSNEQPDHGRDSVVDSAASSPREVANLDEDSDYQDESIQPARIKASSRQQIPSSVQRNIHLNIPNIVTEQSRSTLRT